VAFDAEVIVAGAGPAGAVAARTLALAGVDTLVVDRAGFPRNKPCGGGVSARAEKRFPWLADALDGIDVHRISRLHLEGPAGAVLDLESPGPSVFLIRRVEFDAALVRAAVGAGARIASGFEITQASADESGVTVKARDGRTLRAPMVVAADGVHSVIAKRLGVNRRWPHASVALDMMEETPVETLRADRPDVLWVAYAYGGLDGYAYVFPKVRHVNVGIGCLLSHFKGEMPGRPYALQERFVSSLVESGVLHGTSDKRHFTPFLIPVGGPLKRAHAGRVLFAGDAGGFVNAFTAEGIYYAMVSGALAGQAIAAVRASGRAADAGPTYDRLWRAELGSELSDAVLVQRYLFSSPARVQHVVRGAAAMPSLVNMILEYARGDLSYASLRRRIILRFPLTALRLARQAVAPPAAASA
jgi:geranylgeranyl reductase family protein